MNEFSFTTFIILSFSTWGLTFGLVHRNGAFGLMKKIRESVIDTPWSPLYCLYCTSVWVALVFALLLTDHPFMYWWAATGGAWFIDSIAESFIQ